MADQVQNPKFDGEGDGEQAVEEGEEDDEIEEEEQEQQEEDEVEEERFSELQSTLPSVEPDGSPVNSEYQLQGSAEFKEQVGVSDQDLLARKFGQATQMHNQEEVEVLHKEVLASKTGLVANTQNPISSSGCPTFSYELSPTSVTQSVMSDPSPNEVVQKLSPIPIGKSIPQVGQQNSSDLKTPSALVVKRPSADGFNWRKYGHKQVKSPQGSRSYYRCTYADCCSKKIECSDHVGGVIEVIYRGRHNHEPPRKVNRPKESKLARHAESFLGNGVTADPVKLLNNSDLLTSKEPIQEVFTKLDPTILIKEPMQESSTIPKRKRQNASDADGYANLKIEEHEIVEPEPKQRLRKSNPACQDSTLRAGKKPKLVVHAAGDVGISSDGYRWRKYGQKMVKGNPHPRNYYRCTSAGCPVRKHIETAVDNTSGLIITYKGVHDHDMPVPRKRQGPPSAHLVAASAPASMNNLQIITSDAPQDHMPSTQWSIDQEGELTGEALDLGGEKAMESARTLLSIGFEIKPC